MSHPKHATPAHPIQEFIAARWSPYAYSDRPVSTADLQSLFEAARWAPSSYNEQPWSYIVATKSEPQEYERVLSCLMEANQAWAKAVPVLAIGCTSLKFKVDGRPNTVAVHDLGLAAGNLCLEATARGLCVHQMAGILPDKVRATFNVPEGIQPVTGIAIGYAADPANLPDKLKERDLAPRPRKTLAEFVFSGTWAKSANFTK